MNEIITITQFIVWKYRKLEQKYNLSPSIQTSTEYWAMNLSSSTNIQPEFTSIHNTEIQRIRYNTENGTNHYLKTKWIHIHGLVIIFRSRWNRSWVLKWKFQRLYYHRKVVEVDDAATELQKCMCKLMQYFLSIPKIPSEIYPVIPKQSAFMP